MKYGSVISHIETDEHPSTKERVRIYFVNLPTKKMAPMKQSLVDTDFKKWTTAELSAFIQSKKEIGNYSEMFQKHRIDGSIAHRLTDSDLKEMGVFAIGDRHRIMIALESLRTAKQQIDREKILWRGEETLYWSCCHKCFSTGCYTCPVDLEAYTLRYNYLEIRRPDQNRCGCITCCFGHSYQIDTVDLSNVRDVELEGVPPPCIQQCLCCAKEQEHVRVNLSEPPNGCELLRLEKGEGQLMSRKLKNQVEIMQVMERS